MDKKMNQTNFHNEAPTAILLAAGIGSRISEVTDMPKSLLKINEITLLEHHLIKWIELGIPKAVIVVGYKKQEIIDVAKSYLDKIDISFVENEDYKNKGNTYSLLLGIKNLTGPSIIFDADLIYDSEILKPFIEDFTQSEILIGDGDILDQECAKAIVDENGFVKKTVDKRHLTSAELDEYSFEGEAIGVLKFSALDTEELYKSAQSFLCVEANLNLNWEHLLNEFLLTRDVRSHHFSSERWIEVDTAEDYKIAKSKFEGQ